jgi:MFS family permease
MEFRREEDRTYTERRGATTGKQSVARLLAAFIALLLSLAVLLTGGGLLGSLVALRMEHEGFNTPMIGAVMACYSAGFIIASMYFSRIILRVGHIRAFGVLAALAAGSTLIYPLVISPIAWGVMRGVLGFSVAGLYMVVESWLNGRTPREVRGTVLAFYSIATYAALGSGQLLLNTWPIDGFQLFSLAALLFAVSLLPVALTRAPSPELVQARPVGLLRLYRISPLGLVGSAGAGLLSGTYVALGPVFGRQAGLEISDVASFMAAGMVGGLLLQWPVGWVSDRVSRRLVIVGVSALVALASAAIVLVGGGSVGLLIGLTLLWGGLTFTLYPLSLALSNDFIEPEELIGTGAGLLLVHGVGMMLGPVLVGQLMQDLGTGALFGSLAAVAAFLAVFGLWRQRVGQPLAVADQGHYRAVPLDVTPQIGGLDPRWEEPQLEFDFTGGEGDDVVNSEPDQPAEAAHR